MKWMIDGPYTHGEPELNICPYVEGSRAEYEFETSDDASIVEIVRIALSHTYANGDRVDRITINIDRDIDPDAWNVIGTSVQGM